MFRKSACPFGQMKTRKYLPTSPFFKSSLAGASGLVVMSVPGITGKPIPSVPIEISMYVSPQHTIWMSKIGNWENLDILLFSRNTIHVFIQITNIHIHMPFTYYAFDNPGIEWFNNASNLLVLTSRCECEAGAAVSRVVTLLRQLGRLSHHTHRHTGRGKLS